MQPASDQNSRSEVPTAGSGQSKASHLDSRVCPQATGDPASRPERLLIIDDDKEVLDFLDQVLTEEGYETVTVRDGEQALQRFAQEPFAVVVTDLRMPEVDGLQVLQQIKATEPMTQVILLTAYATLESVLDAVHNHIFDVLEKPLLELDTLIQSVQMALRQYRLARDHERQRVEDERRKDEFIALLSHELRTPLTAILGFSQLMLAGIEGSLNANHRDYVEIIYCSGQELQRQFDTLFSYTDLRRQQVSWQRQHFELVPLIRLCMGAYSLAAARREIMLQGPTDTEGLTVIADYQITEKIVLLLLDNAIKFTLPGGKVGVHAWVADPQTVMLCITDSGIGIERKYLSIIFKEFRQIEEHMHRQYGGLGLGLSLAKGLAELQGGRLWVESEPGKGSAFHVAIPRFDYDSSR